MGQEDVLGSSRGREEEMGGLREGKAKGRGKDLKEAELLPAHVGVLIRTF